MQRINTDSKYFQAIMNADSDLKYPERYIGRLRNKIFIRSYFEFIFITKYCDSPTSPIIEWNSEECVVRYVGADKRHHRYFLDFYIKMRDKKRTKSYLIEIKPEIQTKKPIITEKTKTKTAKYKILEYEKNIRKWNAAEAYCQKKGWIFKIITEKDLGIL